MPIGSYKNPRICNADEIRAAAKVLRGAQLLARDFEETCRLATAGDRACFVYFDSPYAPVSATSRFTSYTSDGFGEADQRRLRDTFSMLHSAGARCMLSNSDTPLIHELYKGYRVERVSARRSISATGARADAAEVIVRNY